jgi:hypothetical protein
LPPTVKSCRRGDHHRTDERVHDQPAAHVRPKPGSAPRIECVTVVEPTAAVDVATEEVRQPADLLQVARRENVVVITAQLALVVRAKMQRRAKCELIGWQRAASERRAPTTQHE